MASNGDKLTGTYDNGKEASAGGNPKVTVDLNSTDPDLAEGTSAASAALLRDGLASDGEKKEEEASKATAVPTGGHDAPFNDVQKKIRRAERFGMPVQLSEVEKRNSRAERFGTTTASNEPEVSKKAEELKRKARAERFGLPVSSAPADEDAKKKARLARFGADTKTDSVEEEKRKARELRFSKPASNSSSQSNGKENISQEAAIAGEREAD